MSLWLEGILNKPENKIVWTYQISFPFGIKNKTVYET
jgi:hypothetical protein